MGRIKHYMYVPFVGLGLYGGFRGERWFRNRLKIFKQFVVPSLMNQVNKDFTLWISFTFQQRGHKLVEELDAYLTAFKIKHVFTYHGVCFYDDKYPKDEARGRLVENLHGSIGELLDDIGEVDYVYMTIQPSDDCYHRLAVQLIQETLDSDLEAVGFKHGYIMNYLDKEVSEYNPQTNPPFYTIKFKRDDFIDPLKHVNYTALKNEVPGYEIGVPLPSHEWVKDCLNYKQLDFRGFLVGTHGENISTYYNHPYKGLEVDLDLDAFGLRKVPVLQLPFSIKRTIFRRLPHKVQKKLRYIFGERLFNKLYNWLRS